MWTSTTRLVVRRPGHDPVTVPVDRPGRYVVGGVEVTVDGTDDAVAWSVANAGPEAVALDAVGLAWDAGPVGAAPTCFVHGYQSWAPTRTRRLGRDEDPSRRPGTIAAVRAAYHADPGVAAPGELRSEQVTVLRLAGPDLLCIGFDGGETHAGTLRAVVVDGRAEVTAEAWLGGAVLPAHGKRTLHTLRIRRGDDVSTLLEQWAATVGRRAGARTTAPYRVGWCSWYHYFHDVTEAVIRDNLARAADWPFTVFQLDDGYQRAIGDWSRTTDRFPAGVHGVADAIRGAGLEPGIWVAPFLAAPGSDLAAEHPEWLAQDVAADRPALGMYHEVWGGVMWQLDTTHPDVRAHLATLAAELVAAGYSYLKLDFTFSPGLPGRFHDPTCTPAERVRAGYEAIREGAGDAAYLLGCGAPLGALVGVVDGMRIGADVAPWWDPPAGTPALAGYEAAAPATHHAFVNTLTRSFQHRTLWQNDPDCVMLRRQRTGLDEGAARAWAMTVGASGGLAVVSDDLALLGPDARTLLDEAVALGRRADLAATNGRTPRATDLGDPDGPTTLESAGARLHVDPSRPRAVFDAP